MIIDYLTLPVEVQRAIIEKAAPTVQISPVAIEKDFWVVWLLQTLFTLPNAKRMVFKGGTSLSKVYHIIQRFSEDIDITIDYRDFKTLDLVNTSHTQLKKASAELKTILSNVIAKSVVPHLQKHIAKLPRAKHYTLDFDEEVIRFYYPSVITQLDNMEPTTSELYLRDHVLIELGIRNSTEPCEQHSIEPILSAIETEEPLAYPEATIEVLSPLRTFWEKATLIHAECHRKRLSTGTLRLARHWYDLAMLEVKGYAEQALVQLELLNAVIEHKKAFYAASYTHFDNCLSGKLRLIPDESELDYLHQDYTTMQKSGMFYTTPIAFAPLIKQLQQLELRLNKHIKKVS